MVKIYEWVASTTSDGIRLHPSISKELEKPYLRRIASSEKMEWDGFSRGERYAITLCRSYHAYARFLGYTGQRERQIRALMDAANACFETDLWDYNEETYWGKMYYRASAPVELCLNTIMDEILFLCRRYPNLSKFLELDPFLMKMYNESYYMNAVHDSKEYVHSLPNYSTSA